MKWTPENTTDAGLDARVFVDGEEVFNVVEADDRKGYAIVLDLNKNGTIRTKNGYVMYKRLLGEVAVTTSPRVVTP